VSILTVFLRFVDKFLKLIEFAVVDGVVFVKICNKGFYRTSAEFSKDAVAFEFKIFLFGNKRSVKIGFSAFGLFAFKKTLFGKAGKEFKNGGCLPVLFRKFFVNFKTGNRLFGFPDCHHDFEFGIRKMNEFFFISHFKNLLLRLSNYSLILHLSNHDVNRFLEIFLHLSKIFFCSSFF